MRKKVLLTGGLIALILILGSTTSFAQAAGSQTSLGYNTQVDSSAWIATIATKLNLTADDIASIKSELASGKSVQQVLADHNITMAEIRTALGTTLNTHHKLSNTQIAMIATKLGLDVNTVQAEIASGKTLKQILKDSNITEDKLKSVLGTVGQGKKIRRAKIGDKRTP